jgi:hypothetical protein
VPSSGHRRSATAIAARTPPARKPRCRWLSHCDSSSEGQLASSVVKKRCMRRAALLRRVNWFDGYRASRSNW